MATQTEIENKKLHRDLIAHDHFWIENEVLHESYKTLRGLRYRSLFQVKGMPDCDNCTEAMIIYIEKEYL